MANLLPFFNVKEISLKLLICLSKIWLSHHSTSTNVIKVFLIRHPRIPNAHDTTPPYTCLFTDQHFVDTFCRQSKWRLRLEQNVTLVNHSLRPGKSRSFLWPWPFWLLRYWFYLRTVKYLSFKRNIILSAFSRLVIWWHECISS